MDLKALLSRASPPYAVGRGFVGIIERPSDKPLIAAIEMFAVAGGLESALSCDVIVAARGAVLGIPEGQASAWSRPAACSSSSPEMLLRVIAMELGVRRATPSTPSGVHALGLVNRLAEPGEAITVALELAEAIAANGPRPRSRQRSQSRMRPSTGRTPSSSPGRARSARVQLRMPAREIGSRLPRSALPCGWGVSARR